MKILDKDLLLQKMYQRLNALEYRHERDFSGGVQSDMYAIRELKTWIGKVQRGEFDIKTTQN